MIVTLTPNPSLDRALHLDRLVPGEVNRAAATHLHPGGKGINVSRALACHGVPTRAVLPSGGPDGDRLVALLAAQDVLARPVPVAGGTRSNVTLTESSGATTKINAPGPALSLAEVDALLDAVAGDTPVVLVSADLHCAWFSTAGLRYAGVGEHPTGLLRESEWLPLSAVVDQVPDAVADAWVDEAARAAARRGVVGVVDLEITENLTPWRRRIAAGSDALRVRAGVWEPYLDKVLAEELRTGDVVVGTGGLLQQGPLKVITDGSLNTRTAYCHDPYPGLSGPGAHGVLSVPPEHLVPLMAHAHRRGLACAIHAIGDQANTLALDAFAASGARGTIEHAQLLTDADVARFAALGVTASVQPEHAMDDRDVADRYWAGRTARAFPLASLVAAGVRLVLGSDAPV
ncbi:amidohydrolase family protein, partial [Cellulomonas hominis]|nr:amidohydrolase family protein [Cellulomonas hominis]